MYFICRTSNLNVGTDRLLDDGWKHMKKTLSQAIARLLELPSIHLANEDEIRKIIRTQQMMIDEMALEFANCYNNHANYFSRRAEELIVEAGLLCVTKDPQRNAKKAEPKQEPYASNPHDTRRVYNPQEEKGE